jgi:hypothetical protein
VEGGGSGLGHCWGEVGHFHVCDIALRGGWCGVWGQLED